MRSVASAREALPRAVSRGFTIERARLDDRAAILDVMRPWNMHHVPSSEMGELDLSRFFVALINDRIAGAAGYEMLAPGRGKTTLLGVLPEFGGHGIGAALQDTRLRSLHDLSVRTVTTNADRPTTIAWYKRRYGYREVGRLPKLFAFGDPTVDYWTTLELDLADYMRRLIGSAG